jgi:hypothetical protein
MSARMTRPTLYRATTFRLTIPSDLSRRAFYDVRNLVGAMEIYADGANTGGVIIGSREVTSEFTNPGGVGGNNYFQLDAGRHAYVWVDDPEVEFIDVAQFWACGDVNGDEQWLHVTTWQGAPL